MSSFLSILLIFTIISLTIFGWWYNSPQQKGKRGEMRIHDILMQLPDEYYVMDDVMLKTTNGTTQIDHIVVSKTAEIPTLRVDKWHKAPVMLNGVRGRWV